jgi:RND superfamily putative drug exporter
MPWLGSDEQIAPGSVRTSGRVVVLAAAVMVAVLLPAFLRLAHHAAWHQPSWLARVLPTVRFAH